jgi:hypothetical protein
MRTFELQGWQKKGSLRSLVPLWKLAFGSVRDWQDMNFTSWFVARTNAGFSFPLLAYFPIGALRYFSGMARALSRIASRRRLLPL